MKATLVDVSTVSRTIDLPDECPKCQMALKDPEDKRTINAWEYQDQKRIGGYDPDQDEFNWDESYNGIPEGGESFIAYVSYWCRSCGLELASGGEDHVSLGEAIKGGQQPDLQAWREEVFRGETVLGYYQWLGRRLEEARAYGELGEGIPRILGKDENPG